MCALLSFFIVWDSASTVRDAREWARKFPNVTRVPVELQDTSLSPARGKAVEYLGYQFEVPWDDLEQSKARLKAGFQPIPFHSGRLIIMEKRGPDEMVHDLQRDANSRRWLTRAWIYDKEAIASDYALTRAALYETPDKVRLLSWPFQANWSLYLLLMKGILVHGDGTIFSISNSNWRGFQFGSPPNRRIELDLYTNKNHLKLFFSHRDKAPAISQSEINRVIQTVRLAD